MLVCITMRAIKLDACNMQETEEGLEMQLAVNVLSIHRLTQALLVSSLFLFSAHVCVRLYVYTTNTNGQAGYMHVRTNTNGQTSKQACANECRCTWTHTYSMLI
jgi:hypothetical protein